MLKDNGAARTTPRIQPLRALWADIKPTITPLEQTNGVISAKESPSEFGFVETKKPMFKSYGMTCLSSSYSCMFLRNQCILLTCSIILQLTLSHSGWTTGLMINVGSLPSDAK